MADVDRPPGFAIRPATPDDVPALSEVLAAALFDDPPARWHIPDDERRIPIMQEFFELSLTALYLPHRLVFTTDPPVAACCWVPPGAWPPSGPAAQDIEPKIRRVFRDYPLTFKVFDMLDANHPSEPHYYLPFMGVLPEWQGRGIGSALLRLGLERCDREGMPAYLDASNEGSRALYLRHAFEVIRELPLPDGPSFWQMWREPEPTRTSERGDAEHRHDGIADELLDGAAVALEHTLDDIEIAFHDSPERFGIESLSQGSGVGYVREQDRDGLADLTT